MRCSVMLKKYLMCPSKSCDNAVVAKHMSEISNLLEVNPTVDIL